MVVPLIFVLLGSLFHAPWLFGIACIWALENFTGGKK